MKPTTINLLVSILISFMLPAFAQAQPDVADSTETDSIIIVTKNNGNEVEVIVNDTVVVSLGKKKMIIIKDDDGTDVQFGNNDDDEDDKSKSRSEVKAFSLDLGVTNYFVDGKFGADAANADIELKTFRPGSHVALNFLPTKASLIAGVVNLETSLTVDYNNYYFTRPITLKPDQPELSYDIDSTNNFSRNKLTARYFQIPLMLNFDTKPKSDDGVNISVGAYGGVLWSSKTKQVTNIDGEKSKIKVEDEFNLNKWRYGLIARVEINWFKIYVQYNLSELFADGEGPSTQTFMAGVQLFEF